MRRALAFGAVITAVVAGITTFVTGSAAADPPSSDWAALRQCESTDTYTIDTGNGYYGAYQFDLSTWRSVGGTGSPNNASPAEQDYRALYLYRMRGWSPWECASIVGLREDASARSGVVPTRADSAYIGGAPTPPPRPAPRPAPAPTCRLGGSTAPAWGGRNFSPGGSYSALACWQKQMATRGFHFVGTGYFGPNTLAAVHTLQARSGIPRSNVIDARTWKAAWSRAAAPPKAAPPKTVPPTAAPVSRPAPRPGVWPGLTAAACSVGARKAPAWPGVSFSLGSSGRSLACWQMQMGFRGYGLSGLGFYGDRTLAAAKDIQTRNNLGGSGLIGPKTWAAAWQGKARS